MNKFRLILPNFEQAVKRFDEVMKIKNADDIVRDSAIQRFEFTFELAWKSVKEFLEEYYNTRCISPKTCFREAFRHKLIEYNDDWIKIADIRNETTHIYNEMMASNVHKKLPIALNLFKELLTVFKNYLK